MGQGDRQRHQLVGLATRVPEHHPLVARTEHVKRIERMLLTLLERVLHPDRDVGGLLLDRGDDATRVAVEAEPGVRVSDLHHGVANDRGDVDVPLGGDLPGDEDDPGRHQGLARDAAVRVLGEHRVQDGVADLVGELVGVSLGYGFG